jgi:hypothetical protein
VQGWSRGANAERAGATGDDVQGSCVRAGDAREPSAGAKPTASGEQTALARGRWANRSWSAAQWKQRVGSGVARIGAKAGDADAWIEKHVRGGAERALEARLARAREWLGRGGSRPRWREQR